ncbi:hypothetical protein P167DRAFT_576023 [Morchella conica CCBAS932]|uniref:Up-regulated during septation protein 1 domain-containing protein n=1 Tax=Morchella conica CCBAS932 TaxID=1392247 RepID=A0A3N4KMY8_9PEZI|nr:hypothetical protein P167DRAFT_576023 [Morchella conica CCBAS932]
MDSNSGRVFNLPQNSIPMVTTLSVPGSQQITARLHELRLMIDIHQDDQPTRKKTYKKQLERYREVRFELCRAANTSTKHSSLTPFQLSLKVKALAEKELALRELVVMVSENYQWMAEKIGVLKKEEYRLTKELEAINKKKEELRKPNMVIKLRAELLKRRSEELVLAAGAAEMEGIL